MAKGKSGKSKKSDAGPKPKVKPKATHRRDDHKGMRVIIRILGTDVDGEKAVRTAITRVKGVGHTFANAICKAAKIDPKKKVGSFTESEIARLEEVIKDPIKAGVPVWLVNRRRDLEDGADKHMASADVIVSKKFDIKRLIDKKTYKGVRHMLGLPVRGQRTRSSFRRGKTVGVIRKSARQQQSGKKK